jgi:hypothetical protein
MQLLSAIGIYATQDGKKLKSAPQKTRFSLFESDALKALEAQTLPVVLRATENNTCYSVKNNDEHHYLMRFADDDILIAIVANKKLMEKELYHLFNNLNYIYSGKIKDTLDDVITNPNGYIGRCKLISSVQGQADQVRVLMQENIKKALERSEKLEVIDHQVITLEKQARQFDRGAKKLNACC